MAIIAKTDIQDHLGITIDAALDSFVTTVCAAAQEYVEVLCGGGAVARRVFDAADTDSTRYYNGNGLTHLDIDDIRSVTSLTVDGVALVENDDYYLYPLNATADGEPFTQIQLIQPETRVNTNSRLQESAPYIFDYGQRTIALVGKFGYSKTGSTPSAIKMAILRIAAQFVKDNIGDNVLREQTAESLGEYSASFIKVADVADRLKIADVLVRYIHPRSNLNPLQKGSITATMFKVS